MTLGQRISLYRKKLNISQEELGARLGVSRQAVSKWETGRGLPSVDLLEPLAEALDLTVSELLSGRELTPEELAQHKTKRPAARRHICLVSWDELDGLPQSSPGILKRYDYENAAAVFQQ